MTSYRSNSGKKQQRRQCKLCLTGITCTVLVIWPFLTLTATIRENKEQQNSSKIEADEVFLRPRAAESEKLSTEHFCVKVTFNWWPFKFSQRRLQPWKYGKAQSGGTEAQQHRDKLHLEMTKKQIKFLTNWARLSPGWERGPG